MSTPRYDPTIQKLNRAMQFMDQGPATARREMIRDETTGPTHTPTPIPAELVELRALSKVWVDGKPPKAIVERLAQAELEFTASFGGDRK